jgi:hypothetical protein
MKTVDGVSSSPPEPETIWYTWLRLDDNRLVNESHEIRCGQIPTLSLIPPFVALPNSSLLSPLPAGARDLSDGAARLSKVPVWEPQNVT